MQHLCQIDDHFIIWMQTRPMRTSVNFDPHPYLRLRASRCRYHGTCCVMMIHKYGETADRRQIKRLGKFVGRYRKCVEDVFESSFSIKTSFGHGRHRNSTETFCCLNLCNLQRFVSLGMRTQTHTAILCSRCHVGSISPHSIHIHHKGRCTKRFGIICRERIHQALPNLRSKSKVSSVR